MIASDGSTGEEGETSDPDEVRARTEPDATPASASDGGPETVTDGLPEIVHLTHRDVVEVTPSSSPAEPAVTGDLGDVLAELLDERVTVDVDAPRLRSLVQHLPLAIWTVEPDGTIGTSFGQGLRCLGLGDGELDGTSISAWGAEAEANVRRAMAGTPVRFDSEGVLGEVPWAMRSIVTPRPGGGAVTVAIDMTDRYLAERELGVSEGRFRVLAEFAPVGIFLADTDGANVYTNATLQKQFGRTMEATLGRRWLEAVHPEDRELIETRRGDSRRDGRPFDMAYRVMRGDDDHRWLHVKARRVFDDANEHVGYVGTTEDITERRAHEAALRESEELTRAILETAAEGIVTFDSHGVIMSFNEAARRIFGYEPDQITGESIGRLLSQPHRDVYLGYLEAFRATGEATLAGAPTREIPGVRRDGSTVPIELALTEVEAHGRTLFTAMVRDISERKEFERQLEHQATHDPLTSLPNRALLSAQLESSLARAYRHSSSVAVLFINLDRIKVVTDSLGHRAGDELRVAAAQRLQRVVRPNDTVTRFGEDEFVILAEDLQDLPDAVELAHRIIAAMVRPFDLTVDEAYITCNVGISFAVDGLGTAESLIADADLAMFRAKEKGGNSLEIFDRDMRAWINERRKTEVALRHALDRDEFELHYQPIVAVDTNRLKGFEALVRWNRPGEGMVPPGLFIPVAEDSGLIVPLGEWIMEEACRQVARWQRDRPDQHLTVSVNLSGRQLAQRNIAEVVRRSLDEAGADAIGLVLEITETVLLDDVEQAVRTLDALKDIGVGLSIDDFGTGYSSLTYLRRFPVDVVKIDQSFVSALGTDSRDASIVQAVIRLAEGFGLTVVAEGVETGEQLQALATMSCDFAQGYYFSRPRPVSELDPLLDAKENGIPAAAT